MQETYKGLPMLPFASTAEWAAWLEGNHENATGIWLMFGKKGSGTPTVSYQQARDLAIAFGWIDGLINSYDTAYFLTRFTPRKPKGSWSKINREVAETLIATGMMRPAGLAHVESAKRDGRWELAYDSPSNMQVPDDFRSALDLNPKAAAFFAELSAANRYAFLYRIQTARSTKVRAEKIEKFTAMLAAGECFHPKA